MLLTIDPARCSGWCVYAPLGGVLSCGVAFEPFSYGYATEMVIEIPEVYRGRNSKGDPNDVIKVALVAGRWIEANKHATIRQVKPKEWKRQLPKDVHHKRCETVLTSVELNIVNSCCSALNKAQSLDAWDAVALSLFHTRRYVP